MRIGMRYRQPMCMLLRLRMAAQELPEQLPDFTCAVRQGRRCLLTNDFVVADYMHLLWLRIVCGSAETRGNSQSCLKI